MVIAYALYLIIPFVMERKTVIKRIFILFITVTSPKELTTITQIKTNKGKKTDTYGEHTVVSPFAPESDKT